MVAKGIEWGKIESAESRLMKVGENEDDLREGSSLHGKRMKKRKAQLNTMVRNVLN